MLNPICIGPKIMSTKEVFQTVRKYLQVKTLVEMGIISNEKITNK